MRHSIIKYNGKNNININSNSNSDNDMYGWVLPSTVAIVLLKIDALY